MGNVSVEYADTLGAGDEHLSEDQKYFKTVLTGQWSHFSSIVKDNTDED